MQVTHSRMHPSPFISRYAQVIPTCTQLFRYAPDSTFLRLSKHHTASTDADNHSTGAPTGSHAAPPVLELVPSIELGPGALTDPNYPPKCVPCSHLGCDVNGDDLCIAPAQSLGVISAIGVVLCGV